MTIDDALRPAPLAPFRMPQLACDSHIHFYGPTDRYPLASTSPFLPPLATEAQYREIMRELGVERCVLVQPAGYGVDNRCLVDGLAALGEQARGVATVRPDVDDRELERLTRAGVRGARALMFPGGMVAFDEIPALAARVRPFGWHVQLQMNGRDLPQHASMLASLPGTLVIDHNGKFIDPVDDDDPALACLLRLLESGRVWVKASAPYETSKSGPPRYADVGRIARRLIDYAPDRVVWASNWPHGAVKGAKPDTPSLLHVLSEWAPDAAVRKRVLTDNPARLYGFDGP